MAKIKSTKMQSNEYFPMDRTLLRPDSRLTFDIFIYLQLNERIILFRKKGDAIDESMLSKLREKEIPEVFVRQKDKAAYEAYLNPQPKPAVPTPAAPSVATPPVPKVVEPAVPAPAPAPTSEPAAGPSTLETPPQPAPSPAGPQAQASPKVEPVPSTPADWATALLTPAPKHTSHNDGGLGKRAEDLIGSCAAVPAPLREALGSILADPRTDHASRVARYALLLASALRITDPARLQNIVLAGLLHDIGICQVSWDLASLPDLQRTPSQAKSYQEHVARGLKLLEELGLQLSPEARTAIAQHHEKFDGSGYPAGLQSFGIDDLGQLLAFSSLLEGLETGSHDGTPRALPEAIRGLAGVERRTSFPQYFNPQIFKRLMAWLRETTGQDFASAEAEASEDVEKTKNRIRQGI